MILLRLQPNGDTGSQLPEIEVIKLFLGDRLFLHLSVLIDNIRYDQMFTDEGRWE